MSASTPEPIKQYLTFTLADEAYAVNVSQVREVLDLSPITRVPQTLDFMRGVINLRGSVVPVVDLRLKLGLSRTEERLSTCIIVVEVLLEGEPTVLGAMADCVQEVLEIDDADVVSPPRMGARMKMDLLTGIGKREDRFIMILDIDKVFAEGEVSLLREAGGGVAGASAEERVDHE